jgi:hypothetical protein
VKLACGNTVAAKVQFFKDHLDKEWSLHKPLEVVIMPNQQGGANITLMAFIPGMDQEVVTLAKRDVVCVVKAEEALLGLYKEVTNPSPVATPEKPGLILPAGAQ